MPVFQSANKPLSDNDLTTWVMNTYLDWANATSKARRDSKKWVDHVLGDMIDEKTKARLKKQGLQALPLNIILPKITRVMGAEISSRTGIKAVPIRSGKNQTAHIFTKLFDKIMNDSDGQREIAYAFLDAIIGDIGGWLEVAFKFDNHPLGQPVIQRIPAEFVFYDPHRQRYDLSKDRAVLKSWFATQDYIERNFGYDERGRQNKTLNEIRDVLGKQSFRSRLTHSAFSAVDTVSGKKEGALNEFEYHKENLHRIVEAQIREEVRELGLFNPVEQKWFRIASQEDEEIEAIKSQNPGLIEMTRKWDRIRLATTLGGNKLLLQNKLPDIQNGMFSIFPLWGYLFGDKPMGLVKNMAAPQELYWKEISSALTLLMSASNPVWMVAKDSVNEATKKDIQAFGNRNNLMIEFDAQSGPAPQRIVPNIVPSGHLTMASVAEEATDIVSSVGRNAVGRKDTSSESGKLVQTRVGETLASLEILFDGKNKTTVLIFTYLIAVIQTKMSDFRVERISGGDDGRIPLNLPDPVHGVKINDLNDGEYGVAIEKQSSRHHREEKFRNILLFAKEFGLVNPTMAKLAIKSFDGLEDNEKDELIQSLQVDNIEKKLAGLEGEVRGQVAQGKEQGRKTQETDLKREAQRNQRLLKEAA